MAKNVKLNTYNLTTSITLVTPELAKKLRATCVFERQRPLNYDHVKRLATEMASGWFLAGTPIWLCQLPDGKRMIINGNHTLEAIATGIVSVPLTIITQAVKDIEGAAQSYICFDIQRSRTWLQAAHGIGLNETTPLLAPALSAMTYIMSDFKENRDYRSATVLSRRARFDELKKYQTALGQLNGLLQGAIEINQRVVKRSATFSIAMVTMQAQPSTAEKFWGEMLKDDGLRVGDPRHALLRYLLGKTTRMAQRQLHIGTALAWNAFYEEREMNTIRPAQMRVFRIAGTAWHLGHSLIRSGAKRHQQVDVSDEVSDDQGVATTATLVTP